MQNGSPWVRPTGARWAEEGWDSRRTWGWALLGIKGLAPISSKGISTLDQESPTGVKEPIKSHLWVKQVVHEFPYEHVGLGTVGFRSWWGGKGRQLLATKARVHIQKLKKFMEQASYSSNIAQSEEVQEILISMLPICPHQFYVSGEMIVYVPEVLWLETAAFSVAWKPSSFLPFMFWNLCTPNAKEMPSAARGWRNEG